MRIKRLNASTWRGKDTRHFLSFRAVFKQIIFLLCRLQHSSTYEEATHKTQTKTSVLSVPLEPAFSWVLAHHRQQFSGIA